MRSSLNRLFKEFSAARQLPRRLRAMLVIAAIFSIAAGVSAYAIVSTNTQLVLVAQSHAPTFTHTTQGVFTNLLNQGRNRDAFIRAVFVGDTLFGNSFNALDGIGANVGNGERFTRTPRADLSGPGQWLAQAPTRATGPNAAACNECHSKPTEDGSGVAVANVHRDPEGSATLGHFIQRNTPHVLAMGATQRLAEEMTDELANAVAAAKAACTTPGCMATRVISAKGVSFGTIVFKRAASTVDPPACPPSALGPFLSAAECASGLSLDMSAVKGISTDLIVRPFQWKGSVNFIRDFNRGASLNEIGMGAVEVVGDTVDHDFDGVGNEMLVGDQTGLAVYVAALPRPTTRQEINALHQRFPTNDALVLDPPFTAAENASIGRGGARFTAVGCATCHIPSLTINNATFTEPSQNPKFRDAIFPAGQNPVARGLNPARPIRFDLTRDTPFNNILNPNNPNQVLVNFGAIERGAAAGSGIVRLFGDLKRHDMGPGLAEQIDELKDPKSSPSTWMTRNLWGVGSTGPYLHDGRATTLTEAILEHGGEGQASRDAFAALSAADKRDLIAFLNNLIIQRQDDDAHLEALNNAIQ